DLGPGRPGEHPLVDIGQVRGAELAVVVDGEVGIGEAQVAGQLLAVIQVTVVTDLEIAAGVDVQPRLPGGRQAVHRPLQQGLDGPGEVVVQRGDRDVRAGGGVVDRVGVVAPEEHVVGGELPPAKGGEDP